MPRTKKDRRNLQRLELEVPKGVYAKGKEIAASIPMPLKAWAAMQFASGVKRWKDPVTGKGVGKAPEDSGTWPSGWPKIVPCPWGWCTDGKKHDPAGHPWADPDELPAALAQLSSPEGYCINRLGEFWVISGKLRDRTEEDWKRMGK